jgi:hypothetical protein
VHVDDSLSSPSPTLTAVANTLVQRGAPAKLAKVLTVSQNNNCGASGDKPAWEGILALLVFSSNTEAVRRQLLANEQFIPRIMQSCRDAV